MRSFISIDLPDDVTKEITKIQKDIDKLGLIKGKFTEPENFHLTLKFLGEISRSELEAVKEKLEKIIFKPFSVKIDKIGVFSEDFIRIVWVSLSGDGLFELQGMIDDSLGNIFLREYNFMAHITIARPKFIEDKKVFLEELNKISFEKKSFLVDKVNLKKSELTTYGAKYSNILTVESLDSIQVSV
ncbi:MAG TPA: RNA 2',3'-cyclic phosphodiesterase [Candidatus Nanoarchaeia archaeon]|nr:RNA 2',3'-cyclic phosphodiesterase [Candidatus Nanoarchaeia archaeon]